MRIIYISSGHFAPTSGAGLTLWSMMPFISREHRVTVYANTWATPLPGNIEIRPLPPIGDYRLKKTDFFFPVRIIANYLSATRLARKIGGETDILHIYNGLGADSSLLITQLMCQKAAMEERAGESLLGRISQQTPKHLLLRLLERHVYGKRLYRTLVPASRFEKDQILKYYSLPPDDIIPVHGGVDFAHYNPPDREERRQNKRRQLGLSPDQTAALFVGFDFRRKGLPHLLRALDRIDGRLRLIAVGGTGGMKLCRRLARKLGIDNRVIFTGPVARESRDFFFAADLFIFPTLFDPFGTAVLEAMAAGLPVVTSRRVGAGELITPEREGYLLDDPRDPEETAETVNRLLEKDALREMGEAGRKTAQKCTWEAKAAEMIRLYKSLS